MNDENNYGAGVPVLDDIEYTAPAAKKGGPTGVSVNEKAKCFFGLFSRQNG